MSTTMKTRCPSDLALESHLLDPRTSGLAPHLDGCAGCQARVAKMEAEGEEFRRFVFPATVDAIEEAAAPRRGWFRLLAPLGGLAAAAAAVMLVLNVETPKSSGPAADYVGVKGDAMGLSVFVGGESGVNAVPDGASIPAAAAIRFKVRPAAGCRLSIVSVDAAGQVSRLFPAAGDAYPLAEASTLPGGAVLDGLAGPERIFAVCAPEGLGVDAVEKAAKSVTGGGAEKVRTSKALPLPAGASQATLLLEKRT